MSKKVFLASLNLIENYGSSLEIGGGEPTLHPNFWEFIGLALSRKRNIENIWLSTNGKLEETALALATLAKEGILAVQLSHDQFHEPIPDIVVKAFEKPKDNYDDRKFNDLREIKGKFRAGQVINIGRAKKTGVGVNEKYCCCPGIFISPLGNIFGCAHKTEKFGTVFNPQIPDKIIEEGEMETYCSKGLL